MLPILRNKLAITLAAMLLLVAVPIQAAHDHHENASEDSEAHNAENADDHRVDASHEASNSTEEEADDGDDAEADEPEAGENDTTAPSVSIELDGRLGAGGWYLGPVTVGILAEDDTSGLEEVEYRVDERPWQVYEEPFLVREPGEHRLIVRASDEAGNTRTVEDEGIRIDLEDPNVEITTPEEGYVYVDDMRIANTTTNTTVLLGNKTIGANASDDTSGVREVRFAVDGEERHRSSQNPHEWVFAAGEHRASVQDAELRVSARDRAGYDASVGMTVSTIPTTLEGLEATDRDRTEPEGAFVEVSEDADGDGIPATVSVWNPVLREYEDLSLDPDDDRPDPVTPEDVTLRLPHNVSLGEDSDGDGLPGEVTVETQNVTVPANDPGNATFEEAPGVTVSVDPDDEDASRPADTRTASLAVPSSASTEDGDGDGIPENVTVETTRVTVDRTTQNVSTEAGEDHSVEVPEPAPPQPPEGPASLRIDTAP